MERGAAGEDCSFLFIKIDNVVFPKVGKQFEPIGIQRSKAVITARGRIGILYHADVDSLAVIIAAG